MDTLAVNQDIGRLTRTLNRITGLYLLFMLLYLVARHFFGDSFWPLNLVNTFALLLFAPGGGLLLVALLRRSRPALLSLAPVLLIGVLWFAPRFIPRSTAAAPDLRVLSNNVWHRNHTPEAVVALAQAEQPDVILLQEVAFGMPLDALNADYPHQTTQIDEIRAGIYRAVNLTLSRTPFVISEKIHLDLPGFPYLYRSVIEVRGQRVALYNVHLKSPDGGTPRGNIGRHIYPLRVAFAFDDRTRNSQLEALLMHLATEPYPFIVAGDFNLSDLSVTYNRLDAGLHDSFAEVGFGLGTTWPAVALLGWPDFIPPLLRMDYIWSGNDLRPVKAWQGSFTGSDHLPLLADFVLP